MMAIGAKEMPLIVFVTAYDEHAIRAFGMNALIIWLKPFSDERFEATMVRIKARLMNGGMRGGVWQARPLEMVSREPERVLEQWLIDWW